MPIFLTFLQAYWKPLAIIAAIGAVWLHGDYHGHSAEKATWEAKEAAAAIAVANKLEGYRTAINVAVGNYDAERTKNDQLLTDAMGDFYDDAAKNPAYATCRYGVKFVYSYRKLAGFAPANQSKPSK